MAKKLRKAPSAPGARLLPIDAALVQAIAEGVRDKLSNQGSEWFGPQQPIAPVAPEEVKGRAFDYPSAFNIQQKPRASEPLDFTTLRAFADSCEVLRIVLERRKDQIEGVEFEIVRKDRARATRVSDQDVDLVHQFFLHPSTEHDWGGWLRCIVEDLLVLDAVAVYPRQTQGGGIYSFDLIDPATIKRVIDDSGRTPLPPDPAFQQVLKGLPAVNYSADEMYYFMRNPRTHKLYGYSPVEQIITYVNIAIRKALHQLQYYTEGNVPEALAGVPETWTMSQIREFQLYWDELMEGNTAQRRHMKFLPIDATKVKETRQVDLKDMFDDWLARLICFCLGVSPAFLIREQNRATAETVSEQAYEEGLLPTLNFLKRRFDYLIQRHLGFIDLEFKWKLDTSIDAMTQTQMDEKYVSMKVLTPDEVRKERFGKEPLTDEEKAAAWPAPVPVFSPAAPFSGARTNEEEPAELGATGEESVAEGAGSAASETQKARRAGMKLVVAPVINIPAQAAPVVNLGDTYVTPPQVTVGAVEVHADMRPESEGTVSKHVRVDRTTGESTGEVKEERK